jgi:ABC-type multidrug transport system ATPase subunit
MSLCACVCVCVLNRTLVKLMSGELLPSSGDIRPHGHLKLGRFTQHFVDVLDLDLTPLEFFDKMYPTDSREDQRKYLGRFGISGKMQVQKMAELSDGQKSRVVFAKLGRDVPHILLLDEPTNHLDMESIDALAKAINEFEGGLVLVSHDMRLISQVAKEIWMCDHKTITPYKGDIDSFKMNMRAQMGIGGSATADGTGSGPTKLRGDASVKQKSTTASTTTTTNGTDVSNQNTAPAKAVVSTSSSLSSQVKKKVTITNTNDDDKTTSTATTVTTTGSSINNNTKNSSIPTSVSTSSIVPGRYIPPHLRKKMLEEQMASK